MSLWTNVSSGLTTEKGNPIRKPTRWLSNSNKVLQELDRRCRGGGGNCSRRAGGTHALCRGMVARRAATYPFRLCLAVLVGFRWQLIKDGVLKPNSIGMQYVNEEERADDRAKHEAACVLSIAAQDAKYIDDLTKHPLREDLVREAINKELDYFEKKKTTSRTITWHLVPGDEANNVTGKPPISLSWVHVNNGDDVAPIMRSRLVAREIKHKGDDAIFSPTSHIEEFRTVLSVAATQLPGKPVQDMNPESQMRTQTSLIDISRAYFNATVDEGSPTYLELTAEHPQYGRGKCAKLIKHMYGTRHAAEGGQEVGL